MVGKTNVAGARLRAVIAVTYPEGSVCTCVSGAKTLKARDTSGYALFNVKAGTYTVECHTSDNSKSKSTSVTVTESDKGKAFAVMLRYALVLFDNGSQVPWTAYNESEKPTGVVIGEESINFNAIKSYKSAATVDAYDMTPYKTAHLIGNVNQVYETDYNNTPRFMVTDEVYELGNYGLANKTFSSTGPVSLDLDISNITGSHKIEIWGTFYGTITQVWLTED